MCLVPLVDRASCLLTWLLLSRVLCVGVWVVLALVPACVEADG